MVILGTETKEWNGGEMSEPAVLTVTIREAKRITGLSHDTIYKLIKRGRVKMTKIGRRTLVSYASLQELMGETPVPTPVPTPPPDGHVRPLTTAKLKRRTVVMRQ